MADPMLTKTSVTVRYTSNDGYSSDQTFKIYPIDHNRLPPEQPLIDAVEELARLTALFGFEDKALAAFNEARKRVFDWREGRKVGAGKTAPKGHNAEVTGGPLAARPVD